jgi:hypothetical protein
LQNASGSAQVLAHLQWIRPVCSDRHDELEELAGIDGQTVIFGEGGNIFPLSRKDSGSERRVSVEEMVHDVPAGGGRLSGDLLVAVGEAGDSLKVARFGASAVAADLGESHPGRLVGVPDLQVLQ